MSHNRFRPPIEFIWIRKSTDTDGSYLCECKSGYDGDGKYNCRDVNECKLIIHVETDNVTGEDINYGQG